MKLLDKYNRISLLTTILVIIITGIIYYFTISYILTGQVDKDLVVEENEIFDYVRLNHKLPQVFKSDDLKIHFQPIADSAVKRQFINTRYLDEQDREREAGRGLISSVSVQGVNYRITIIESKVKTEDLIRVIFFITLGIILVLMLVLVIINRLVIKNLWQPFYQMLRQIKLFNLTDHNSITTLDTAIEEFKDMNQEVTAMSLRVSRDYQELKSFVENAAHELMTPLAVMNSKLDTLMQSGELTNRQGALIGEVYAMVSKMKKLNKSMLLLSRIENRLIHEQDTLDLKQKVNDILNDFQELFIAKQLKLSTNLQDVTVVMNKDLADILLNNLLGNAIRHNYPGGDINVLLNNNTLTVANTGKAEALENTLIFQRFHKSNDSEGTGLGLTLSREICESYGFKLTYSYQQNRHTFTVHFDG